MKKQLKLGLYGILTNPKVGYEQLAKVMVDAGLSIIQLRMKDVSTQEVVETGKKVRAVIPDGVVFIMNDSPQIALEVGADGVHLGQRDMSYSEARKIVGEDYIIGLSTHNPIQTDAACALSPDYIGVGPVYATPTKKTPDPVIGFDGMQKMLACATVPAVCLGGIDHSNAKDVVAAGAKSICAVRCINQSLIPDVEIQKLLKILN